MKLEEGLPVTPLIRPVFSGEVHDSVSAPNHYLQTKISPLEVIEDWKLDFHLGSVIKYIGRHQHKGAPLEDLKKAQWYLARKIKLMEETE